jgi:hypothetical protein
MSYCGKTVKNLSKYQHKINKYQKILDDIYGIHHNDLREGNVCIDNKGQIYLIDFGWSREYQGVGGYGKGKIGNTKTEIPVTKKELLDFLKNIYYSDSINLPDIQSKIKTFFIRENDPLLPNRKKDNSIKQLTLNVVEVNEDVEIINVEENKIFEINNQIDPHIIEENKANEENGEIINEENGEIINEENVEIINGENEEIINGENGNRLSVVDVMGCVDNSVVNMSKVIENNNIEVIDVTTFKIQRQGNPYLWSQI